MATTSPVILILGSGPRIGQHVAKAFSAKGYKVALASRSQKKEDSQTDQLHIAADLSDPHSVKDVFSNVEERLGLPSVVVYNAAAAIFNSPDDPLAVSLDDFTRNFMRLSRHSRRPRALRDFLSNSSKTFIYTGNILNDTPIANLFDVGVGKTATAYIIRAAATAYSIKGFKFYYADERKADGTPAYSAVDGDAHGDFYAGLAGHKTQGPWQQTFVKGIGYKQFPDV
ncbi:hypothetical protein N7470_004111 [Penicillium chermesinum]|nr:hypothetical protein N7470_004111 [Penicillium chermesinum]